MSVKLQSVAPLCMHHAEKLAFQPLQGKYAIGAGTSMFTPLLELRTGAGLSTSLILHLTRESA